MTRPRVSYLHKLLVAIVLGALCAAGGSAQDRSEVRDPGVVPQLIGVSAKDAKAAIENRGLVAKFHLGNPATSAAEEYAVYAQAPSAGTRLAPGDAVDLTIYGKTKGSTSSDIAGPLIPDLLGLSASEAEKALDAVRLRARFRVGKAAEAADIAWVAYGQTPQGGTAVASASEVLVTLYDAPDGWGHDSAARLSAVVSRPFLDAAAETVDPQTGVVQAEATDLVIPAGPGDLRIHRTLMILPSTTRSGLLGSRWRMNWEKRLLRAANVAVIEEGPAVAVFLPTGRDSMFVSFAGETLQFESARGTCTRRDGTKEKFDADGRLTELTDRNGNKTHLRYDTMGQLVRIDGPFATWLKLISDQSGRVTRVDASSGAVVHYFYGSQEVPRERLAGGMLVRYAYGNAGELLRIEHPGTGAVTLGYDGLGRVTSRSWADGASESYVYDDLRRTRQYTDPVGHATGLQLLEDRHSVRLSDALGQERTLQYDQGGRLVAATAPTGRTARFRYDGHGRLASIADSAVGDTLFEFEGSSHNPVSMRDPYGHQQQFAYDANRNLASVTDGRTNVRTVGLEHLPQGLLTRFQGADGREYRLAYDANGRLRGVTDEFGKTTTLEYDGHGNLLGITDPLGNEMRSEYDAHNRPVRISLPDGTSTRLEYSEAGHLVRIVDHHDRTTTFEYDARGRVIRQMDPKGRSTRFAYNRNGRLTSLRDDRGRVAELEVDPVGRSGRERYPNGREVSYRYDAAGRLSGWSDNLDWRRTLRYDQRGRLTSWTDSLGATTQLRRSSDERQLEIVGPRREVERRIYDAGDRLVEVHSPQGDRSRYGYDASGRLDSVRHPGGGESRYQYDAAGQLTQIVPPTGKPVLRKYDEFGRLAQSIDGKGQATAYDYDRLSRLVRKTLPDGKKINYQYDPDGHLVLVDDGQFPVRYGYDAEGKVTSIEYAAIKRKLLYQYDDFGRLATFTDSGGKSFDYQYDDLDRLSAISQGAGKMIRFTYDQADQLTSTTYPNGVVGKREYDAEGRITRILHSGPDGKTLAEWKYVYDESGNPIRISEAGGQESRFGYDPAGQLLEESRANGDTIKYSYLPGGNRETREFGAQKTAYAYDQADQLTRAGEETFVHDANGNLVERQGPAGTTRYSFDAENRLIKVALPDGKQVEYGYAPTGERIWRQDAGGRTWYVTDGVNVVAELDDKFQARVTYLHRPEVDQPLAMFAAEGPCYFHADRLGHVRQITDAKGAGLAACSYDAFGVPLDTIGERRMPFTFGAREYDAATGLYYFRARYFDPKLGRFLSVDPVDARLENPLTLNPYLFALNAPSRYVDPWGTDAAEDIARSIASSQAMGVSQVETARRLMVQARNSWCILENLRLGGFGGLRLSPQERARFIAKTEEYMMSNLDAAEDLLRGSNFGPRWPARPPMFSGLGSGGGSATMPPAGSPPSATVPAIPRPPAAPTRLANPPPSAPPPTGPASPSGGAPATGVRAWIGKALGVVAVAWTASNVYNDPQNWPVYVGQLGGGMLGAPFGPLGGIGGSVAGGYAGQGAQWVWGKLSPPKDYPTDRKAEPGLAAGNTGNKVRADDPELLARAREAFEQMIRKEAAGIAQTIEERERLQAIADDMERIRQSQVAVDNQWVNDEGWQGGDPWADDDWGGRNPGIIEIDREWLEEQLRGADLFPGVPDFSPLGGGGAFPF